MEIVLRTAAIYLMLLLLFRVLGKRSLAQLSAFDFVVFLVVSEALQNALVVEDRSVVMGLTVVVTFLLLDVGMSWLKRRFPGFERLAEGVPTVLVERGRLVEETLRRSRITESDILQKARETQGLERLEQVKYAVLEASGGISIIPEDPPDAATVLAPRLALLEQRLDRALRLLERP